MRRLALSLLTVLLLAACAGAPQTVSRGSGNSVIVANGAYHAPPPGFPNFVDHSIGREEISIQAMSLVGVPYRWGGNTPESGFDCSGLVRYVVLRAASVNLPRTTADMSVRGESIEPDQVAPGDLIFFNTTGRAHSHVGIYVGKLRFVNAPSTGGTVRLDYLTNPYWAKRFDGIRRMAGPVSAPAPFDTPSYQAAAPQPERGMQAAIAGGAATAEAPSPVTTVSAPLPAYATEPQPPQNQSQQAARVAEAQVPLTTQPVQSTATVVATSPIAAVQPDQFEPPPPGLSAAQIQARAAGAISPTTALNARARTDDPAGGTRTQPAITARSASQSAAGREPDAIDAAADAFEPPPPAAVAERQAQQAQRAGDAENVQIMRASTGSRGLPAPTQTNDDPIARFANGNF